MPVASRIIFEGSGAALLEEATGRAEELEDAIRVGAEELEEAIRRGAEELEEAIWRGAEELEDPTLTGANIIVA